MKRRYSPRSPSVESRGSVEAHTRYKRRRMSTERYLHSRGDTERDDRAHTSRAQDADYYREYSPESNYRSSRYARSESRKRRHHTPPPSAYSPNERSPTSRRVRYRSPSPRSPRTRRRERYGRNPSPKEKSSPQESRSGDRSPAYDDDDNNDEESCNVGSIIKGRYRILQTLGDSTFSKVVQAYDYEKKEVIALEIVKNLDKPRDNQRRDSRSSAEGATSRTPASRPPEVPAFNYQYGAYPYGVDPRTMLCYTSNPTFPATTSTPTPQNFPPLTTYPPTAFPPPPGTQFPRMPPPPGGPPQLPPYFPPWGGLRPPPLMAGPRGPPMRSPTPTHIMSALAKFRSDHPHLFFGRPPKPEMPTARSKLLDRLRILEYSALSLTEVKHHIVEFSQDQHGSRFIQTKLKRASPQEQEMVFEEILNQAYDLMQNMFGNYVIQKFFEMGTQHQRSVLVAKMKGHVMSLAFNIYGCRVLQKALESVSLELQLQIVQELMGHVISCVKDQNGNHVIQKSIETIEPDAIQFIVSSFHTRILDIGSHPYGCRVVQKLLQHCTPEQKVPLLKEFHECSTQLMQNQFGNYVVQHVLEQGEQEDRSKIVGQIFGKVFPLAQHKFASNVVEKCVVHATRGERTLLIEEICAATDHEDELNSPLCELVQDQYGNYVVQKMIELATESQRKTLVEKLSVHVNALAKTPFGKHFFTKMKKYFEKWYTPDTNERDSSPPRRYRRTSSNTSDG